MVFDVPAESGGALSVLYEFYNEFKLDQKNEYIFVLSFPELKEISNIKVLRFPWIKKSWGHRLYFDNFVAHELIKEYEVDQVLSLQNIIIPHTKVYQSVVVQNALPFSEYRFSFIENKLLWVYQNIIGRNIMNSIKKADHIIVQTNYMKKKCIEKLRIKDEKIEVKQPKINFEVKKAFKKGKKSLSTFFYPASGMIFKNHKIIVDACLILKKEGFTDYSVLFTLEENENKHIVELNKIIMENNLPVKFIGTISREQVFDYYSMSVLVFPSYIESMGLPLLEAKLHNTPVLASDCSFSHELLDNYDNVDFFDPFSSNELLCLIKKYLRN